jgi:hypothetical protein
MLWNGHLDHENGYETRRSHILEAVFLHPVRGRQRGEACTEIIMQNIYISFSLRPASLKICKPAVHEHKVLINFLGLQKIFTW